MTDHGAVTVFRRPTREDAIALAARRLARGERVDIQGLAADLGVNRSTVHRWVGDRDTLVGEAMVGPGTLLWQQAWTDVPGRGLDATIGAIRRFMILTSQQEGLVAFAQREPEAALRILLTPDSPGGEIVRNGISQTLADRLPEYAFDDEVVAVMAHIGTVFEWANIAAGLDPAIDEAANALRLILRNIID